MMFKMFKQAFGLLAILLMMASASWSESQETSRAVKVTIKDGKAVVGEAILPIDMTPRIAVQYNGGISFGITVEGKRITCSPNGSIWHFIKIDGQIHNPFNNVNVQPKQPAPLPPTATGKKRLGTISNQIYNGIDVTQIIEIVPGKPSVKSPGVAKRQLDTCRVTYILENKDQKAHKVAFKTGIDILIVNNDGALYASPTTAPGKILNGVALQGKDLPEYLWVLERPDLTSPGYIATMTLKHSKGENPSQIVLSNLGAVLNFNMWDIQPQPAGDSACALFWEEKELKPGQKRTLVWGYGGGISTGPENEGRVEIGLGGSFETDKRFTITAHVEDPAPEQALSLELPAGMELIEGSRIQPVAPPAASGSSLVLWKARVARPGNYEIRVRSSTGTMQSKHVLIEPIGAP